MTSVVSQTDSDVSKDLSDRKAFHGLKNVRWRLTLFWVVLVGALLPFAVILAAPIRELQSIALGSILVVIIAVAVSMTLLPVLLSCLGDRINKGRTCSACSSKPTTQVLDWWFGVIAKSPLAVMSAPVLLSMAMAIPATRINVALSDMEWLPATARPSARWRTFKAWAAVVSTHLTVR